MSEDKNGMIVLTEHSIVQFLMKVAILGNILGSLLARALKNYICSSISEATVKQTLKLLDMPWNYWLLII
jgi:hypothetical protein